MSRVIMDRMNRWAQQEWRPKEGTIVRFCPPPGAYSPKSEQHRQTGKSCLIIKCWNDSMATGLFGEGRPLTINLDYIEEMT